MSIITDAPPTRFSTSQVSDACREAVLDCRTALDASRKVGASLVAHGRDVTEQLLLNRWLYVTRTYEQGHAARSRAATLVTEFFTILGSVHEVEGKTVARWDR